MRKLVVLSTSIAVLLLGIFLVKNIFYGFFPLYKNGCGFCAKNIEWWERKCVGVKFTPSVSDYGRGHCFGVVTGEKKCFEKDNKETREVICK